MRRRLAAALILAATACLSSPAAAADLQPYAMIRSLQLVQDRIANGDDAALPMQRELLEIIDERLRTTEPGTFEDDRNFRALLIYAMSGGNPTTIEMLLSKLDVEAPERSLGDGLVSYIRGDFAAAREALDGFEPMAQPPQLGAFVALVRGALASREDPATAVGLFDQARLLSPGTLVEEAALRRSIAMGATLDDTVRFSRASQQYVSRFLGSPYASQFAEAFVSAVVTLYDTIDLEVVDDVVSHMNRDQAHTIYLRLARKSAIEGYEKLLSFASERAREHAAPGKSADPRALLYSSIATVTSQNVTEVLETLRQIDRRSLSANDRELLDAASAVARKVMERPDAAVDVPAPDLAASSSLNDQGTAGGGAAPEMAAAVEASAPGSNGATADTMEPEAGDTVSAEAAASPGDAGARATAGPDDGSAADNGDDIPAWNFVADTRDKLREIDTLLEESEP